MTGSKWRFLVTVHVLLVATLLSVGRGSSLKGGAPIVPPPLSPPRSTGQLPPGSGALSLVIPDASPIPPPVCFVAQQVCCCDDPTRESFASDATCQCLDQPSRTCPAHTTVRLAPPHQERWECRTDFPSGRSDVLSDGQQWNAFLDAHLEVDANGVAFVDFANHPAWAFHGGSPDVNSGVSSASFFFSGDLATAEKYIPRNGGRVWRVLYNKGKYIVICPESLTALLRTFPGVNVHAFQRPEPLRYSKPPAPEPCIVAGAPQFSAGCWEKNIKLGIVYKTRRQDDDTESLRSIRDLKTSPTYEGWILPYAEANGVVGAEIAGGWKDVNMAYDEASGDFMPLFRFKLALRRMLEWHSDEWIEERLAHYRRTEVPEWIVRNLETYYKEHSEDARDAVTIAGLKRKDVQAYMTLKGIRTDWQ